MWLFSKTDCVKKHVGTYVAVVTAFPLELEALLEKVEVKSTCVHRGVRYYFAHYLDSRCVFVCTGVGQKRAKKVLKKTLSLFSVSEVVVSGLAGAVAGNLSVGDVVVPHLWQEYRSGDTATVDANSYKVCGSIPNVVLAEKGVTVRRFADNKCHFKEGASIVDMESYSFVAVAQKYAVPCIVIKSVSDPKDNPGSDESFTYAAHRSAEGTFAYLSLKQGE